MRTIVLAVLAPVAASQARGQACPPADRADVPAGTPFFEFQVETPARFIADTGLALRPVAVVIPSGAAEPKQDLVQFVVDTAGVPVARTFKVLRARPEVSAQARAMLARWRFRPAMTSGCRVAQLVQTAVGR